MPNWSELNERERKLLADLEWAQTAPEVQRHHGQLVVVRGKRVLGVGVDRPALVRQAAAQEGCSEFELVVVVVPPEGLVELPH
jgi:hypothetical protein